jgi:hypothetical protein
MAPADDRQVRAELSFIAFALREGDSRTWQGDLRALWSPVLFSVPTPMGFSAPLLTGAAAFGPPDKPDASPPFLAVRETDLPPAGFAADVSSLLRPSVAALPVRVVAAPAFPSRRPATNNVIQIMWSEAHGGLRYQAVDVGNAAPWTDRKPWDAQALLELDGQGTVRHVFLEKATAQKERNAALIRILSTLRMEPTSTARTGRVTVRYEGAAESP